MNMLIDDKDLALLVERKRDFIGSKPASVDIIFSGVSFALSTLAAEYSQILFLPGTAVKTTCFIAGLAFAGYGIFKVYKSRKKENQYTKDELLMDIANINRMSHPHSLVAVKDTFNPFSKRFLLYHDDAWDCDFFFNFRTDPINDEAALKAHLSNTLNIDSEKITVRFVDEQIYTKYSERDRINKCYDHKLYYAEVSDFPEILKQSEFTMDGVSYRWLTIREMESDPNIQDKNLDVVNMVKQKII